jgi:hypothetical protein
LTGSSKHDADFRMQAKELIVRSVAIVLRNVRCEYTDDVVYAHLTVRVISAIL